MTAAASVGAGAPSGPLPVRGAVWDGRRLQVVGDLELRAPGPGEVRVRVEASGICQSDLHVLDWPHDGPAMVPGHEAAGVVDAVGPEVTGVAVGDEVTVASPTPCGTCRACRRGRLTLCPSAFSGASYPFRWRGTDVRAYANVSSFASAIVVRAGQLTRREGLAAPAAALVGCAVSTGYGAARNVVEAAPGDAIVVFGIGGIGVNVLQAARYLGATTRVAVDVNPAKEAVARRFGADRFVLADRSWDAPTLAAAVREAAGGELDAAVECSGVPVSMEAALLATSIGGATAWVGHPRPGTRLSIDADHLQIGRRRLLGSLNGDGRPGDQAEIVRLALAGELELDAQVTQVWPLAEITEAIDAVRAGAVVRAALDLTAP